LSDRSAFVTLLAFHHSVCTKQRKPVEVLLDRLNRDVPAAHRVALGAVGAHLTAMNIRVAIRAILADVREHRLEVACRAVKFFVHAAKRITRGVVVEFRHGANRNPACAGVTVLARNGKGAMRTSARLSLGGSRKGASKRKNIYAEAKAELTGVRNDNPRRFELAPAFAINQATKPESFLASARPEL
jgi:hypothetical protein